MHTTDFHIHHCSTSHGWRLIPSHNTLSLPSTYPPSHTSCWVISSSTCWSVFFFLFVLILMNYWAKEKEALGIIARTHILEHCRELRGHKILTFRHSIFWPFGARRMKRWVHLGGLSSAQYTAKEWSKCPKFRVSIKCEVHRHTSPNYTAWKTSIWATKVRSSSKSNRVFIRSKSAWNIYKPAALCFKLQGTKDGPKGNT